MANTKVDYWTARNTLQNEASDPVVPPLSEFPPLPKPNATSYRIADISPEVSNKNALPGLPDENQYRQRNHHPRESPPISQQQWMSPVCPILS